MLGLGLEIHKGNSFLLSKVNSFITVWKTDNAGASASNQITIPTVATGIYDCVVDWGDGLTDTITTYNDAAWTHTYSTAGTYTVKIYGTFTGLKFANGGDKAKILAITRWGAFNSGNQTDVFSGCANLNLSTISDTMDLTGVTTLATFFSGCTSLTSIQNIGDWNTSNLSAVGGMFLNCTSVNPDVEAWDTGNMVAMNATFFNTAIDRDLSNWNVISLLNATNMFNGVTLSTENYNKLLNGWSQKAVQPNVTFNGGNSNYDTTSGGVDGVAAKAILTSSPNNWTITDGGLV